MAKHPKANQHKDDSRNDKGKSKGKELIQKANAAPGDKPPADPQCRSKNEIKQAPAPQMRTAIIHWLTHYWDAPREKSKKTDIAIVVLTLLVAIAAFWSAGIFQSQLTEMRRATEIQERPWLSVEAKPVNGLIFVNGQQPVLVLKFSVKNVGHSIAKNVQIDVKMFPTAAGMPFATDAIQRQRELCDHPKISQIGSFDLFPVEQPAEREMDISSNTTDVVAKAVGVIGDKARKIVGLYVVGCVTYRFSFGPDFHQTHFAYHLMSAPPFQDGKPLMLETGMPAMTGFEVGVNVPKEQVGVTQELFALNDAN